MNNVTVLRHHCTRFLPGRKQPKHPEWQHHGKDYPPFQSIFSGSLVGQRLRVSCYHDPTHVMPVLINSSVFGERSKPADRRPLPRKCCSTAMPAASVSEGPVPSASRDTMVPTRIRPAPAVLPGVAVFPQPCRFRDVLFRAVDVYAVTKRTVSSAALKWLNSTPSLELIWGIL